MDELKSALSVKTRNILPTQPAEATATVIDLGEEKTFPNGVSMSFDLVNATVNGSAGIITLKHSDNTNAASITMNGMRNMKTGIYYVNETDVYRNGRYSTIDYIALSSEISFRYIRIALTPVVITAGKVNNFLLKEGTTPSEFVPYIEANDYTLQEDTQPSKIYSALSNILINNELYRGDKYGYLRGKSGEVYSISDSFTSEIIPVNTGDVLDYTLSCVNDYPILLVYNKDRQVTSMVLGTGQVNMISGSYTFTNEDSYFSINGTIIYKESYKLYYNGKSIILDETEKSTYNIIEKQPVKSEEETVVLDLGADTTFTDGITISFDALNATQPANAGGAGLVKLKKSDDSITYCLINQLTDYNGKAWNLNGANTGRFTFSKNNTLKQSIVFRYVIVVYKSTTITSGTLSNFMITSRTELRPYVPNASAIDYVARAKLDNIATPETLPDYWIDAINTAKSKIIENELLCDKCASLFFVTDTHWASDVQKSTEIIKRLAKEVNTDFVINGGDVIANKNTTKLGAADEIVNYISTFSNSNIKLMSTIGNHDTNKVANSDTTTYLSYENLYNLIMRNQEWWMDTKNTILCNYYDNNSQKIRYIQFYYTVDSGYIAEVADALSNAMYSTPKGWNVVLISHAYWNGSTPESSAGTYANLILSIMDDDSPSDESNKTYFSGNVALWICGHTHADRDTILTSNGGKKLLIVSTSTDSIAQQITDTPSMARGTATEQCIDYIQIDTSNKAVYYTRLGAGSDRTFSYA